MLSFFPRSLLHDSKMAAAAPDIASVVQRGGKTGEGRVVPESEKEMLSQKHQQISVYALFARSVTWLPVASSESEEVNTSGGSCYLPGHNWDPVG